MAYDFRFLLRASQTHEQGRERVLLPAQLTRRSQLRAVASSLGGRTRNGFRVLCRDGPRDYHAKVPPSEKHLNVASKMGKVVRVTAARGRHGSNSEARSILENCITGTMSNLILHTARPIFESLFLISLAGCACRRT